MITRGRRRITNSWLEVRRRKRLRSKVLLRRVVRRKDIRIRRRLRMQERGREMYRYRYCTCSSS
jgi:hypothetical protein